MVSPQIILVVLAVIAFFATGGIDKASRAISTAKSDFTRVKGSITDFQMKIADNTLTLGKDERTALQIADFDQKERTQSLTRSERVQFQELTQKNPDLIDRLQRGEFTDFFKGRGLNKMGVSV